VSQQAVANMGLLQSMRDVAVDIKLIHTVFALPFALLGAMLAGAWSGDGVLWWQWVLVLLAMFFARTMAMTFNRFMDAPLDAANPRTANRAIPAGRVGRSKMLAVSLICALLLIITAGGFWLWGNNPWPIWVSPIVIAVLMSYSLMKRFTRWCHVVLGLALGLSPVAAAMAVDPTYLGQMEIWLLLGAVLGWVAGFDVIYALQDVATDREQGLFSLPSRLGEEQALWISRTLHLMAWGMLLAVGLVSPWLDWLYLVAVFLVGILLIVEHTLVWVPERRRIAAAFGLVNGLISVLLGVTGVLDVLLGQT